MATTARAEDPPDIYFDPRYVAAASIAESGEPLCFTAHDGAWQMPTIVRSLGSGPEDAITPTFSGVYASPSLSVRDAEGAWMDNLDALRQRGVISLVVRGSAGVPQASSLPGLTPISTHRPAVVIDLVDDGTAWAGMKSECRTRIRKAEKTGYTGRVRQAKLTDLLPGGEFRQLYEGTMARVGADPLYTFTDRYYTSLLEGVGSSLLMCEVLSADGEVVSACLLLEYAGYMHYHLAGSRPEDSRWGTNNLMMWTGIRFAIDKGLKHFHIGAGASGRDSVFRFKTTFGGREATYDVSGVVIDEGRYAEQVRLRAQADLVSVRELEESGFFPAYRAG